VGRFFSRFVGPNEEDSRQAHTLHKASADVRPQLKLAAE
jgi:hypothetical protein